MSAGSPHIGSRSDPVMVAVGFNPRHIDTHGTRRQPTIPRRAATFEMHLACRRELIEHISLIKLDFMFAEKRQIFLLKGPRPVVFSLALDVGDRVGDL